MTAKAFRAVLLASACLVAATTSRAADLFEPAGLTSLNWAGFYVGGHLGLGMTEGRGTYSDGDDSGAYDQTPTGWLGGAHAGYNWQFGRMVYGVEVDATWANIDGYQSDLDGATFGFDTSFLASARFRSGIAADNVLLFGSIGLAYSNTEFRVDDLSGGSGRSDFGRLGLSSGFGAEWAFAPNWSLRGEYIYYWFNDRNDLPLLTADSEDTDFARLDGIHTFRIALNYHFGGAAEPMMMEPALDWSGFYVGLHGGYGWSRILGTFCENCDFGSFDFDPKGFVGGVHAGYNWQDGAWVYGIEADVSWSGMDGDRLYFDDILTELETDVLASLRGRIGIAAGEKLFYLTGGIGYTRSDMTVSTAGGLFAPNPASISISDVAPVIGSGVEWSFAPNWNVRLEGLTYFFDERKDLSELTDFSAPQDFLRQSTVSVIRAGINYRF